MSESPADFLRDPALLRRSFCDGLHRLLDQEGLGPFILVLANALLEDDLHAELEDALKQRFGTLQGELRALFGQGLKGDFIEEDLLVFLKMALIGFDGLQRPQSREAGPWRLQFNHLRSFRPMRITRQVPKEIVWPFDAGAFNFNKPFIQKECFWAGELFGRKLDLFYNKYPFAPLHGLWAPDRDAGKPQFITHEDHDWIWRLAAELGEHLPDLMFGYNSFGAYASVNHLHFQGFVEPRGMPVMQRHWEHHGGDTPYPVNCRYLAERGESWECLAALHADEQPYNALFVPGGVYLFPRRTQGTVEVPDWSSGFTWFELAGSFIVSNYADYQALEADALTGLLSEVDLER